MMMSEFTERTGFEPTVEEYAEIEQKYYEFSGDKNAFCEMIIKQGIVQQYMRQRVAKIKELEANLIKAAEEIHQLKEELEKEQEWKPCSFGSCGTNLSQDDYDVLLNTGGTEILTDARAKAVLLDFFGFSPEKVTIVREVNTYEVNRHRKIRKAQTFERQPLYNASDWNYIRFDCAGRQYEMINDGLIPYNS